VASSASSSVAFVAPLTEAAVLNNTIQGRNRRRVIQRGLNPARPGRTLATDRSILPCLAKEDDSRPDFFATSAMSQSILGSTNFFLLKTDFIQASFFSNVFQIGHPIWKEFRAGSWCLNPLRVSYLECSAS
jgi:hypothetical protein